MGGKPKYAEIGIVLRHIKGRAENIFVEFSFLSDIRRDINLFGKVKSQIKITSVTNHA